MSAAVLVINIHSSRAVTLRRERQRGRQNNNSFNKQNNNLARAAHFFIHFFAVFAGLRRENAKFRVLWRT